MEGEIRAISVSNFHPDCVIGLIVFNNAVQGVNQIETLAFNQQSDMQKFLSDNNVQFEPWETIAEGPNEMFQYPVLWAIVKKCKKSVVQLILHYLIQRGVVAIPKSVRSERITENFNIFDLS